MRNRVKVGVIVTGVESELRSLELDPGLKLGVEVKDRARVRNKKRVEVGARGMLGLGLEIRLGLV